MDTRQQRLPILVERALQRQVVGGVVHAEHAAGTVDVPQENLFLIAGCMVVFTFVPLYYAAKEYKKRVGKK